MSPFGQVSSVAVLVRNEITYVACGGANHSITLWDLVAGECVMTLEGHSRSVNSVSLSADGVRLVSGSHVGTVRIWDTHICEDMTSLLGHSRKVVSVAISADGALVVSGSYDSTIKIWNANTGEDPRTLRMPSILNQGFEREISSVAISRDRAFVISGSRDKIVRIWSTNTGECLRKLEGQTLEITSVAIANDSTLVVSGSRDKTVRFWDPTSGDCLYCLRNYRFMVTSLSFDANESQIIINSRDLFKIPGIARPIEPSADVVKKTPYALENGWLVNTQRRKLLWGTGCVSYWKRRSSDWGWIHRCFRFDNGQGGDNYWIGPGLLAHMNT